MKNQKGKYEEYESYIPENQRKQDLEYYSRLNDYFSESIGTNLDKLKAFPKYVPVSELGRFLAKDRIFQKILNVQGSIVECGVYLGGGLMAWATLSSIFEPLNHLRKVIGFDSFEGFTDIHEKDKYDEDKLRKKGELNCPSYEDLKECVGIYDLYRPLGHIPKVEIVKGDAMQTIGEYLERTPHLVVSLLYLDFDLYEPTKNAMEKCVPRMPKGAVIAFDQLNQKYWPGETSAVLDSVGLRNLRIERFSFQPQLSYAVLE
jgi:hypothetical protein